MIDPNALYITHARDAGLRRLLAVAVGQSLRGGPWQSWEVESHPYLLRVTARVSPWWWLTLGIAHLILRRRLAAEVALQCRTLRLTPAKIEVHVQ